MVLPITCNAVGDIIAVAQLIHKIVTALSDSRGASREYEDLLRELRLLHDILRCAIAVATTMSSTISGAALEEIVDEAAKWKDELEDLRDKIEGYQKSLRKSTLHAVAWVLFRQDEIKDLRERLSRYRTTITLWLVMGNTIADSVMLAFADEARRDHMSVKIKLNEILTCLRQPPQALGYSVVNRVPLIDAQGNERTLDLGFCTSWDKFDQAMKLLFSGCRGGSYIHAGQYTITCGTGEEMNAETWSQLFRRDLTLEMSIVIAKDSQPRQCPLCGQRDNVIPMSNGRVECLACQVQFRSKSAAVDTPTTVVSRDRPVGDGADEERRRKVPSLWSSRQYLEGGTNADSQSLEDPSLFKRFNVRCPAVAVIQRVAIGRMQEVFAHLRELLEEQDRQSSS